MKYLEYYLKFMDSPNRGESEDRIGKIMYVLEKLKYRFHLDPSIFFDKIDNFKYGEKILFDFHKDKSTWYNIQRLLDIARSEGKAGYVAQHLVGAKLQLRFPDISISNESASTADKPTKRQGDFTIGDTVFHVTVAPMQAVFEKCKHNMAEGLKVYLLVPDGKLAAARQMAEEFCNGHIAVESLESFVSQNMEEISGFNSHQLKTNISNLIKLYNQRVDAVEIDKSLMIELPSNLYK